MNEITTLNTLPARSSNDSVLAQIAGSREVTETQACIMVSKRFPRNEMDVLDKILLACQRPALAETALYSYAKGGAAITGPSIRLAETVFRLWGNGSCGLRELESNHDNSVLEAYAIDYETNARQSKVFTVKHERSTKKGNYAITDPRERYENLANFGARRLRACILSLIPADIIEAATEQCEETLKAKADTSPAALQKVIEAFDKFGVSKEQIELRIQRRFETITPAQLVQLRKVYNSLKDGMSSATDWFQIPETNSETLINKLKTKLKPEVKDQLPGAGKLIPDHVADTSELIPDHIVDANNMAIEQLNSATENEQIPAQQPSDPWAEFRDGFINLKSAGFSTFFYKNIERFKICPLNIRMEAVAKWDKLYPNTLFPLNKAPVALGQLVEEHGIADNHPQSNSTALPVSYSPEYKLLQSLKEQFPQIYAQAKDELKIYPESVMNCLTLTAKINQLVDASIDTTPVNDTYDPPPVTDTSGF